jgi:Plasmid pRiA4b ORF-3-like protein
MPDVKPSYGDLVHQVVRQAAEPLPFDEIMRRVHALLPITTKNPKSTIRNAVSQSQLIVNTGSGRGGARYGWKYRVINGSTLRLPLSESDLAQRRLLYTEELRDALWPAFFEIQKRNDHSPVHLRLPDGAVAELTLEFLGDAQWGSRAAAQVWDWLKPLKPHPGDELIFHVLDGEARLYGVEFQRRAARDEQTIAARNQEVVQAALDHYKRTASGAALWETSSHLLATGQYKHPVPPDPLEQIWTRDLWEPELNKKAVRGGWVYVGRRDIDLLLASLLEQIGEGRRRRKPKKERGKTPRAKPQPPSLIYQIKVTLQGSRPPIWRRFEAPGDISLPRLHAVLQIVMGWTNSHMHQFKAGGRYYGKPEPDFGDDLQIVDERQVRLNQIAPRARSRFVYEYDFGDSWEHELVVEKILSPEAGVQYPRCLDGQRACPPDDVGGVWGYQDFLDAIRDPNHPDHEDMVEWIGGEFDPEAFDLRGVNGALQLFQEYVEGASR